MKGSIVGLVCIVCACLYSPPLAAARLDDATATQAYLRENGAYARAAYAEAGASVAAIEARGNQIAGDCPGALTYAPRDAAFYELGQETEITLLDAGTAPLRSAMQRLAGALGHLTWSNHTLTQLVHAQAAEESVLAELALPDVCADIAAWKVSAYSALPQSTRRFLGRLEAIESASTIGPSEESRETAISHLLRPHEAPSQRKAAMSIQRLQARTSRRLTSAAAALRAKLASALGVSAL